MSLGGLLMFLEKSFIYVFFPKTTSTVTHQRQRDGKRQRKASSRQSCFLGLEMRPELVWEDWDLRREFTKTLVLKNIHNKLRKLHVRPPASKFFTTSIPQTVVISPGTSLTVPITFRPLQRCEYEDSIEFESKDGSFQVCLHATIPCRALEVPDSVLLPLCAVQHSVHTTFLLRNVSKLQTHFQWECSAPFKLSPEQGLLKPGQECDIMVVFQPQEALVYQQHACCRFGEQEDKVESCCTVLLQGLGTVTMAFSLIFVFSALLQVTESFSLSRLSDEVPLLGSEFSCDVSRGEVAPGGSVQATVTYTPAVVDTVSVEYLALKCRGALNKSQLKLIGNCKGPKVSLSSSLVDFGCVEEGGAVMQTLELLNSSPVEAIYQLDLDCSGHSVFSIQPASGTVRPHSHTILKAVYRPTQPIAHHRRVACLILHRDPMFLDLIGTCHSELQKPAILKPEHLVLYKLSWSRRMDTPDSDLAKEQDHIAQLDQQGVLCPLEERPDSVGTVSRTPMEEYYQSCFGFMDPLSFPVLLFLLINLVSFPCDFYSSLVWTAAQDSPFSVSPSSCDLAPLKSTSFRVNYDPKQLHMLHAVQLECFAYNKVMFLPYIQNYVEEYSGPLLCPPWCVTVRVIGNSFQPGKEHFIPCCSLKPPRVFPAFSILSYRTALFQNCGDLPLTFCLDHSSNPALAESLSVVPGCGLIKPGHHQILTLRTTPTEDGAKEGFSLHLQLNAAKNTKELTVVSVVEKPSVSLEGDGSLYFHPTAVGSGTQRSHHIRNLSRIPLRFQWSIPEPDQKFISVEPDAGELHPNESSVQIWSFSPLAEETYTLKPTLTFWPIQTPGCNMSQLSLKVVGEGCKGFIEVGSKLYVSSLKLDCERGTIASRSKLLVRSTLRPRVRAQYLWTISYQTLNARFVLSPPQTVCEVRAKGVFPILKVIDACGGGSAGRLSKLHLWKLFSLDSLNEKLLCKPSPAELTYRTPTRHSLRSCPDIFTHAMLDFKFSAAPLNSDPSTIVLIFHNPGSIPVDWAFLFPEDQEIELEYWAETGEFSSMELYQMKVQDNRLFSISPRSGTLLPGQQRAVHLSYSHEFAGTDRFPVVFKLSYGREILLNFQGVTVERSRPCLHLASKQHVFTSVTIGDCAPPIQVYELHNGGAVPVRYEVDSAALSQLQEDNFNHPVLCCLNPQGEVLPGKMAMLEWIFSPLQAKMYHMDVPIHIQDGESVLQRFEGCGVNPGAVGSKNILSESMSSKPYLQRLPFPGQVALLSEDSVSLGDIPVNSRSSRILFLTNVSHTDTVHYTWDMTEHEQQVEKGVHRERCKTCRKKQANPPSCVGLFTLTTPLQLVSRSLPFQTLPPISASSSGETVGNICTKFTRAERRVLREAAKVWRRPEPPQPALLHLGVTAHSHGLPEYRMHFPDQFNKHYRWLEVIKCNVARMGLLSTFAFFPLCFSRSILDDPNFTDTLINLPFKPITYRLPDTGPSHCSSTPSSTAPPPTSSHPTAQPLRLLSAREQREQHNIVDKAGTAGRPAKTQHTPHTEHVAADMCEDVLLNALQNLMMEAFRGELDLTAHPRSVILPPASTR
uniref:Cilia and flagella associated protein 65 n=1 Tax=Sparus aurata TaxID=8175 RepID=A0A671V1Z9_SPAAU